VKDTETLPVEPTGRLADILVALEPRGRVLLKMHLLSGTSADWLAVTLTSEGYPIGASTIRSYRQLVKMHNEGRVTYSGPAAAMAERWGNPIINNGSV